MGLLSSLFGKSKSDANEQKKQDKKNFDILKYDGIRARNMGKLPYAIKCFEEAVHIKKKRKRWVYWPVHIFRPTVRRMHVSPLTG